MDADQNEALTVRLAEASEAETLHQIVQKAFQARFELDPPAQALCESAEDIAAKLAAGQLGLVAEISGVPVGCLLVEFDQQYAWLHRVSVLPEYRLRQVASTMVYLAADLAVQAKASELRIFAREEMTQNLAWWQRNGFEIVGRAEPNSYELAAKLPTRFEIPTAEQMRLLGRALAKILRAGDLIVATGELGSGKTTLTQGLGAGLGVQGAITSPTFVLSRIHRQNNGPALVHVDAYRLGSAAELADIDLDDSLADSITLVEWGEGLAEQLSDNRLEIVIKRSEDPADDTRTVDLLGHGPRWAQVDLTELAGLMEELDND